MEATNIAQNPSVKTATIQKKSSTMNWLIGIVIFLIILVVSLIVLILINRVNN